MHPRSMAPHQQAMTSAEGHVVGPWHGAPGRPSSGTQHACRFYADPCPQKQPGIYAIRALLQHYATSGRLHVYLDLHAHANRQGVFAYGNALTAASHVEALLFCKLSSMNSPYFDFGGCNFSEKNMASRDRDGTSKDGTGRVALHHLTHLPLLYTVEANYNRSRHMPEVPPPAGARAADASPVHSVRAPERFDADAFHQVPDPARRYARPQRG